MNLFSLTSLITSLAAISLAAFIYTENQKSKINLSWLIFSVSISFWSLALFGVTSAEKQITALYWQYLLDFSAVFIPYTYYLFIATFIGYKNRILDFLFVSLSVFLLFFTLSPLYKTGVGEIFDFYWVIPGPYYLAFPLFFLSVVLISLFLLWRHYFTITDRVTKNQTIIQIVAAIVGFGGGLTNFFPQLFNIYPFGNYLVLLYIFSIGYGILRYGFSGTKVISTQLFSGALVLIFLFNLLKPFENIQTFIINLFLLIFAIFFSALLVSSVKKEVTQREKIEKLAGELAGANEELKNVNKQLETVNVQLEVSNAKLKELDKQKTEFVSIASHQLRSPLTAIKGYTSMLLEGSYGQFEDRGREALDRIFQSINKLNTVIEDFLNITRIELGRMKYEISVFDLGQLAEGVVRDQRPNVEKKGLTIEFQDGSGNHQISADSGKVGQVISNLIDNAIKYTPAAPAGQPQNWIKVTVENVVDKKKEKVRFIVADSGVGLAPEAIKKLFNKFVRAEGAGQINIQGTGLGLYVAKQIVEGLGGKISAESDGKGQGSRFIVEFPRSDQPVSTTTASQVEAYTKKDLRKGK